MANLTIRNLPNEVHARLKAQARRNRRSLNQEVIAELSAIGTPKSEAERLAEARERMRQALEGIDEFRKGMKRFMTPEEIDQAIEEGRA